MSTSANPADVRADQLERLTWSLLHIHRVCTSWSECLALAAAKLARQDADQHQRVRDVMRPDVDLVAGGRT